MTAPTTAVSRFATAVAAPALVMGLFLAGCGSTDAGANSDPEANGDTEDTEDTDNGEADENGADADGDEDAGADEAATELTVEVNIDEGAEDLPDDEDEPQTGEWTLTCEPEGGDHPDPEAACADLAEIEVSTFEPVDDDQMCTHIYGGPHVASVTGIVDDTEVDANFSRANGCEIDRWDSMGAVLDP